MRTTYCVDASVEAAITRKVAAQGGQVIFHWLSYVPGSVSGGNTAPVRQFRLRVEKPTLETIVATCRKDLRQLGPTAYEWSAANFHLEEDVHVLFID